ncbi:5-formyltetrahydrofolate cyclo-ligase [Palleronia aestuarii]|uniref:5-formyltetrahydrofolate cyclo-ligase n=1 Tax=Palleronia aestuarii TaxID=568105 RepID=A0A2W7NG22_9RHOB|nr:5-formyltetrahydrofolate cyclo-ligase [Palleronia aestuarii]PZX18443.1 5-formyltetrahydrofolate cyclo-ligase [Palleronia aestuarii]
MSLAARKDEARKAAFLRRTAARAAAGPGEADLLSQVLDRYPGRPVAGYAALRTEIDPSEALARAARSATVGLPVVVGAGQPLRFRSWHSGVEMTSGPFGAPVPATGDWMIPEIVIVPLVAFDQRGGRLGYGGGFYDRTLALLRRNRNVLAVGFAFAAQEACDLPLEPTDEPLDLIVTERAIIDPA